MTYHLCWIVVSCSISCNCSNVISKSMELICAHTEECTYTWSTAATALLLWSGGLWDFRCCHHGSPFQWPSWPASPSTMSSSGTSFRCWGCWFPFHWWFLFTCCFLTVLGALFFRKSAGFKCTTHLLDPVAHLFSQRLGSILEYLKSWWRMELEFCTCMPSTQHKQKIHHDLVMGLR